MSRNTITVDAPPQVAVVGLRNTETLHDREGPCLDSYRSGQPVVHPDLATTNPWPRFGAVALEAGLPSVHAFPMRLCDRAVGTLNLAADESL